MEIRDFRFENRDFAKKSVDWSIELTQLGLITGYYEFFYTMLAKKKVLKIKKEKQEKGEVIIQKRGLAKALDLVNPLRLLRTWNTSKGLDIYKPTATSTLHLFPLLSSLGEAKEKNRKLRLYLPHRSLLILVRLDHDSWSSVDHCKTLPGGVGEKEQKAEVRPSKG
ncbi:hypothetical protein PanWU01x14_073260 [Parasponia andersonii]|uniref:Uncharacterized protein n=1 Tax=Parasponia andersonii TaxID=3476 RepID=A0A2P5DE28_PARAD|nr:hypothetical protein PanWU01x14_073260 [Parasponia andersonii]